MEKVRFEGKFLSVTTETRQTPKGTACFERVYVRGGVTVIVITSEGTLRFIRERLWTTQQVVTKMVTGFIEDNEKSLTAAKRELQEELGLTADVWQEYLCSNVQGSINRVRHYFIVRGLHQGEATPEDMEHIEGYVDLTPESVRRLALDGSFGTSESAYVLLRLAEELSKQGSPTLSTPPSKLSS